MASDETEDEEDDVEDLLQQMRMEKYERDQCRRLMQFLCLHHRRGVGTMRKVVDNLLEECEEDPNSSLVEVFLQMMPLIAHVDEQSLKLAMDTYGKLLEEKPGLAKQVLEGLSKMDLPLHGSKKMVQLASVAMENLSSDGILDAISPFVAILNDRNFQEGAQCISRFAENMNDDQRFVQSLLHEFEFNPDLCMKWIEYCRKLERLGRFETSTLLRFMDWTNTYKVAQSVLLYSIQRHALDFATFRHATLDECFCETHSLLLFLRDSLLVGPRHLFEWWLDILPCITEKDEKFFKMLTMHLLQLIASHYTAQVNRSSCWDVWYAPEEDYESAALSQLLLAVVETAPKGSFQLYRNLIQHTEQAARSGCPSLMRALCVAAGSLAPAHIDQKEDLLADARTLLLTPQPLSLLGGSLLLCAYLNRVTDLEASRSLSLVSWVDEAAEDFASTGAKWCYTMPFIATVARQCKSQLFREMLRPYVIDASSNTNFTLLCSAQIGALHEDDALFLYPARQNADSAWTIAQHVDWLVEFSALEHMYRSISTEITKSILYLELGKASDSDKESLYHIIAKSGICFHEYLQNVLAHDVPDVAAEMLPAYRLECLLALDLVALLVNNLWDCFICEGLDFDQNDLLARIIQYLELESTVQQLARNAKTSESGHQAVATDLKPRSQSGIIPEVWFYVGQSLCHTNSSVELGKGGIIDGVIKHSAHAVGGEMATFLHKKLAPEQTVGHVQRPFLALEQLIDSNFLRVALDWCEATLQSEFSGVDSSTLSRIYWIIFVSLSCARTRSPRALLDVLENLSNVHGVMSSSSSDSQTLALSLVGTLEEQLSLVGDLHTAAILLEIISLISKSFELDASVGDCYEACLRRNLPLDEAAFEVASTVLEIDTPFDVYGHFARAALSRNSSCSRKSQLDFFLAVLWNSLGKGKPFPSWLVPVSGADTLTGLKQENAWVSVYIVLLKFHMGTLREKLHQKDADLLISKIADCSLNIYRLMQLHRYALQHGLAALNLTKELMHNLPTMLRALGQKAKYVYAATVRSSSAAGQRTPAYLPEMCTMAQQLLRTSVEFANGIQGSPMQDGESLAYRIPVLTREISYMSSHLQRLARKFDIEMEKLPTLSMTKMKESVTQAASSSALAFPQCAGFLEEGLEPSDPEDSDGGNNEGRNTFFISGNSSQGLVRDTS
mmetsp:Transcript_8811/g.54153  ORF Transcript_8811/g.54153 Transcript_8811/m.54153 type:complete len:1184 (+) Transcript_8811:1447-4998(+)